MLWTDFDRFGSFIDPWRSLERLNRVISGSPQAASTAEFPAINIWADGEAAVVTAELPGVEPKTVDISVMGKSVTLRASRNAEGTKDEESYHRQERCTEQSAETLSFPIPSTPEKSRPASAGECCISACRALSRKNPER